MTELAYCFLSHLDSPKRILSFTLDELGLCVLGFALLVLSPHKILVGLFGLGLLLGLRALKKGEGPRVLLLLAYWYLPSRLTSFFLPKLPASHLRLWIA